MTPEISARAFEQLQLLFQQASGIALSADKVQVVLARLTPRLEVLGYGSFDEYCQYLRSGDSAAERQTAIDLLTTNETYFFREPNHFIQLGAFVTTRFGNRSLRVWSAACSSGEEAYSIAMVLLDRRPDGAWQLLASDLSFQVLERARLGIFPLQRIEHFPAAYLKRFCLRGKGAYEGTLRVVDEVRARVQFVQHNLLDDAISLGTFDVIFLRNVLIYFDVAHRRAILGRVLERLQPNGLLFVGHAETLRGLALPLRGVEHAVFEKVA